MALTNVQALDVVIGCVHGVSGRRPGPTETLRNGGIVDAPRLQAWRGLVTADPVRGVGKHRHQVNPATLSGIAETDSVQFTANVVRANGTPLVSRGRVAASEVAAADTVTADRKEKRATTNVKKKAIKKKKKKKKREKKKRRASSSKRTRHTPKKGR
jgi:hypothetical protein